MCADVSHFQHPISAEFTLHRKIPLLRIWRNKPARDNQTEYVGGWNSWSIARIRRRRVGVVAGKALQDSEARHKSWINHTGLRQSVRIWTRTSR